GAAGRRGGPDPEPGDSRVAGGAVSPAAPATRRTGGPGRGEGDGRPGRLRHPSAEQSARAAGADGRVRRRPGALDRWAARWITPVFESLEAMIARHGGGWAFGDSPTLADCCLVPQVYSARRFNVPLEAFPAIRAIETRAAEHPAFVAAHPDRQPDAG